MSAPSASAGAPADAERSADELLPGTPLVYNNPGAAVPAASRNNNPQAKRTSSAPSASAAEAERNEELPPGATPLVYNNPGAAPAESRNVEGTSSAPSASAGSAAEAERSADEELPGTAPLVYNYNPGAPAPPASRNTNNPKRTSASTSPRSQERGPAADHAPSAEFPTRRRGGRKAPARNPIFDQPVTEEGKAVAMGFLFGGEEPGVVERGAAASPEVDTEQVRVVVGQWTTSLTAAVVGDALETQVSARPGRTAETAQDQDNEDTSNLVHEGPREGAHQELFARGLFDTSPVLSEDFSRDEEDSGSVLSSPPMSPFLGDHGFDGAGGPRANSSPAAARRAPRPTRQVGDGAGGDPSAEPAEAGRAASPPPAPRPAGRRPAPRWN